MRGCPRQATLVEMRGDQDTVTLVLDTAERPVFVTLALEPADAHALRHLLGLHAHASGCAAAADVGARLLVRCIRLCGGVPLTVVVRDGQEPAFWLRLLAPGGAESHVDLSVLDGLGLVLSRHLPIEVDGGDVGNWDSALAALLDKQAD